MTSGTNAASQREMKTSVNISQHKTKTGPVPIWMSLRLNPLSMIPRCARKSIKRRNARAIRNVRREARYGDMDFFPSISMITSFIENSILPSYIMKKTAFYFPELDTLRFLAFLLVLVHHGQYWKEIVAWRVTAKYG